MFWSKVSAFLLHMPVVRGPTAWASLGFLSKMQIIWLRPDLLNQNIHFNKTPDSYALWESTYFDKEWYGVPRCSLNIALCSVRVSALKVYPVFYVPSNVRAKL